MLSAEEYLYRIWKLMGGGSDVGLSSFEVDAIPVSARYNTSQVTEKLTNPGGRGVIVFFDVVSVAGGGKTVQLFIDAYNPASNDYACIFQSAALSTTGCRKYVMDTGVTDDQGQFTSLQRIPMPAGYRVRVIHSSEGSGDFYYSVGLSFTR